MEQLLLEAGRKSGGLSHAVALQLGGLCAAHPECAACYSASFGRLLLEGSLDPDLEGIAGWSEPVPPGSEEEGFLQVSRPMPGLRRFRIPSLAVRVLLALTIPGPVGRITLLLFKGSSGH